MSTPLTILITGASSGLGQALAYRLAKAGQVLVLTYAHNPSVAKVVKDECLRLGAPQVFVYELRLDDPNSLSDFLRQLTAAHPRLDVLVNNAGLTDKCRLADFDSSFIQKQIDVNLTGAIKLTSQLLPHLNSLIINIGSNLSFHGKGGMSVYTASKFGLRGFTQSLALECHELKSYLVNPGNLGSGDNFFTNTLSRDTAADIISQFVIGRLSATSGADLQLREYLYGRHARYFLKTFLLLKKVLRPCLKIFF